MQLSKNTYSCWRVWALPLVASLVCSAGTIARAAENTGTPAAYSRPLAQILLPVHATLAKRTGVDDRLAATVAGFKRGQHAKVCEASRALWAQLTAESARLFFIADRRHASVDGIERFLDRNVRAKAALLEIAEEGFAPSAAWRSMAAVSCLAADRAEIAVQFLATAAARQGDSLTLAGLAVAMAADARDWAVGAATCAENRVAACELLRALANPPTAPARIAQLRKRDLGEAEAAAVQAVERQLKLAAP